MSEEVKPKTAVDLPTEFDSPTFIGAVSAEDAAAIRAILDRQGDAWNRHDMDDFVADTMPDVDWINVVGMHWKGRDTVRRAHAVLHTGMFAHSRLLPPEQSEMRQIAPNVVIETHINRLEGVGPRPDGKPYPDDGNLITMVFDWQEERGVTNCELDAFRA